MATHPAARAAAVVLLVGISATACSDDGGVDDVSATGPTTPLDRDSTADAAGDPLPEPTTPPAATQPTDDDPPTTSTTTSPPASDPSPSATATTDPPDGRTPADDAADVGSNGRAILRGDRPSLVVEIDAQQGVVPDEAAVAHLMSVLDEVTDKPAGIRQEGVDTFASTTTTWTTEDLRGAAAEQRSTSTTDDEVSIHVLYVAGSHGEDDAQTNAIGLAYSASTIALFPDRWQGLSSMLGSSQAIERAVLVHEIGHLLGLVNLGYTSDMDHEDPDQPGHSDNEGSVMFHAVETTLIGQVFSGPPPSTFDEDDLSDLEGLRTGRL